MVTARNWHDEDFRTDSSIHRNVGWWKRLRGTPIGVLSLAIVMVCTASTYADFTESFNGGFDHVWLSTPNSYPQEHLWDNEGPSIGTVSYVGSPAGSFVDIGTDASFRMTNTLAPLTRVGLVTEQRFANGSGFVEARINTLTQDLDRIDQFIDLWLINSEDSSQYVRVGLFGSNFSTDRGWSFASSIDGSTFRSNVNYANDTWYRIRIETDGASIGVSVVDESQNIEIVQHTFSHALGDSPDSTFRIGLAQFMGTAGGQTHITDVAVDYVRTSLVVVPEPSSLTLLLFGAVGLASGYRRRRRNA